MRLGRNNDGGANGRGRGCFRAPEGVPARPGAPDDGGARGARPRRARPAPSLHPGGAGGGGGAKRHARLPGHRLPRPPDPDRGGDPAARAGERRAAAVRAGLRSAAPRPPAVPPLRPGGGVPLERDRGAADGDRRPPRLPPDQPRPRARRRLRRVPPRQPAAGPWRPAAAAARPRRALGAGRDDRAARPCARRSAPALAGPPAPTSGATAATCSPAGSRAASS